MWSLGEERVGRLHGVAELSDATTLSGGVGCAGSLEI